MSFWIQTSNPIFHKSEEGLYQDLSDAIQSLFPTNTEEAIFVWNNVPIRLSYKYDMSIIVTEAVDRVSQILDSSSGQQTITWSSNTFHAEWTLRWKSDELTIQSKWFAVAGRLEDKLNLNSLLRMHLHDFISEWKLPFKMVINALDVSRSRVEASNEIANLRRIEATLPRLGKLYSFAI